ncbi:MAG TPA: flagellar basal body P-ring formation chaperone FlgA [Burkholderiaceae bacterium]|nr:flagellar basal body P-ring formation chaperone FlgA [Burkholderiaceae bacterium]
MRSPARPLSVRLARAAVPAGVLAGALGAPPTAQAQGAFEPALFERVHALAQEASRAAAAPGLRVEVRVGRLDARLKLAPCADVRPYLPAGMRLWGAARIGLRCHDSAVRWNVFLPITVDVYGPALVAHAPLPAGHTLAADDLRTAEVLLSATPAPALQRADTALGRTLARPLAAGAALHGADLRARQWFAAGDTVRVVAVGSGWRIAGEGQALAPGLEGQSVRVRTESGRIVAGVAVGEREVEVPL